MRRRLALDLVSAKVNDIGDIRAGRLEMLVARDDGRRYAVSADVRADRELVVRLD